jgi:hypothetical protein
MAVKIELKRSAVPGKVPTTSSLSLGELAINTHDGKLYYKQDVTGSESIVEVATISDLEKPISKISTGSVTASVHPNEDIFLIKSGSNTFFSINEDSTTTINSNLFIIKNYTTQQSVLTVSQSIVQFATQSSDPTGSADVGGIWFTSSSLYVGLE